MNHSNDIYRAVATSLFGIESVLANELKDLGFQNVKMEDGRVFFDADSAGLARANMMLRTAERVYIVLNEFDVYNSDSLYEGVKNTKFEDYITKNAAFPVNVNLIKTPQGLLSKSVSQKTVKRAIVDRLRHIYKMEIFPESGCSMNIIVHIIKNRAMVLLNTSGAGLNRRGYREYGNAAPLRETLAAALVLLSKWRTDTRLIDPFCGSGTILIEAAWIALGIAPNAWRDFPMYSWEFMDMKAIHKARNIIRKNHTINKGNKHEKGDLEYGERTSSQTEGSIEFSKSEKNQDDIRRSMKSFSKQDVDFVRIEGYDIDPRAIKQARINAEKAGVLEYIHFQTRDIKEFSTAQKKGTIISNLPYGERLEDIKTAAKLNTILGSVMSKYDGFYKFFYTAHPEFQDNYGKKANKNRKLYNGGIKAYYYMYFAEKSTQRTTSKFSEEMQIVRGDRSVSRKDGVIDSKSARRMK